MQTTATEELDWTGSDKGRERTGSDKGGKERNETGSTLLDTGMWRSE